MTVLYTSRPRALRLARRVSSRAVFVASGFARGISPPMPWLLFLPFDKSEFDQIRDSDGIPTRRISPKVRPSKKKVKISLRKIVDP